MFLLSADKDKHPENDTCNSVLDKSAALMIMKNHT